MTADCDSRGSRWNSTIEAGKPPERRHAPRPSQRDNTLTTSIPSDASSVPAKPRKLNDLDAIGSIYAPGIRFRSVRCAHRGHRK
jgi:hypothetical protein